MDRGQREAVADCMGPNGKPTVAQFCAFAVLEDGPRVKTENSTNDPYCEGLFQAWVTGTGLMSRGCPTR